VPGPVDPDPLDPYCSKTVGLKFSGVDLTFELSHGLFSSFAIDAGTRLLLKTVAQRIDLDAIDGCLDLGCGVGVLGICVARRAPRSSVVLQDRDALAVAIAGRNAKANACDGVSLDCGLGFWHLGDRVFDLILSNIPAKAGAPVLRHLLGTMANRLTPEGRAAIVVVAPLAPFALETVNQAACVVDHQESTPSHTVLHFHRDVNQTPIPVAARSEDRAPYVRATTRFSHGPISYTLETVYGLREFDTLDYATTLAFDLLGVLHARGRILVWNPGQGHMPVYLCSSQGNEIAEIHLAGVDFLELVATNRNLGAVDVMPSTSAALPCEAYLEGCCPEGSMDLICASPHPVPRAGWQAGLSSAAARLLRPGGCLLVSGSSTEIQRYVQQQRGAQVIGSRKLYGHRAVLLRKL